MLSSPKQIKEVNGNHLGYHVVLLREQDGLYRLFSSSPTDRAGALLSQSFASSGFLVFIWRPSSSEPLPDVPGCWVRLFS